MTACIGEMSTVLEQSLQQEIEAARQEHLKLQAKNEDLKLIFKPEDPQSESDSQPMTDSLTVGETCGFFMSVTTGFMSMSRFCIGPKSKRPLYGFVAHIMKTRQQASLGYIPPTKLLGKRLTFSRKAKKSTSKNGVVPSRLLLDITWGQVVGSYHLGGQRVASQTESDVANSINTQSTSGKALAASVPTTRPLTAEDRVALLVDPLPLQRKRLHGTSTAAVSSVSQPVLKKLRAEAGMNTGRFLQDDSSEISVRSMDVAISASSHEGRERGAILVEMWKIEAAARNDLESLYKHREASIRAEISEAQQQREVALRVELAAFYQKENERREANLRAELETTYKRDVERCIELEGRVATLEAMQVNWEQRIEILQEEKAILVAEKELDERKAKLVAL
ncbi:hypothetical protein CPB85DRAFT_1254989 [Mucidula mucida]|nr:hypothetical protein CPB85DRAFT_1254989 [Mucidula mucida]